VGIDEIGRRGFRQQKADRGCIGSMERSRIYGALPDQPGESRLHAALFVPVPPLPVLPLPVPFPQRVVQHRPPPRRVEQSNVHGMLDEPG